MRLQSHTKGRLFRYIVTIILMTAAGASKRCTVRVCSYSTGNARFRALTKCLVQNEAENPSGLVCIDAHVMTPRTNVRVRHAINAARRESRA